MTSHTHIGLQFERIVFFSDAVFAIAITLLIIEIKIPQLESGETSRDFLVALLNLTPKLIGFLLSFFVIGAYWVGHHRIYGHIVRWDYGLVWLNILFLATIAFMPFSTAFFSEYLRFVPLVVYSSTFAVAGLLQLMQWRYALRHDLVEGHEDPMVGKYLTWRMTLLPLVGLFSIFIGYFDPRFSGFAFFLIPIFQRILKARFGGLIVANEKTENPAA